MRAPATIRAALLATGALALLSCESVVLEVIPVTSVTVSGPDRMYRGDSARFTASFRGAGGETLVRTPSWSSSNDGVATVDGSGQVTAVAKGQAEIRASADGRTEGVTVTVVLPVATIEIEAPDTAIHRGQPYTLVATLRDEEDELLTDRGIAWSSAEPSLAIVHGDGELEVFWPGTVRVNVEAEGIEAHVDVRTTLGMIAYHTRTEVGAPLHLYTVALATGHSVSLVTGPENETYPHWSPDGRRIIYTERAPGVEGLFGLNVVDVATGAVETLVPHGGGSHIHARWSPDGTRIVYAHLPGAWHGGDLWDPWDIHVMNADGSGVVNLTGGAGVSDVYPSWSPDGTRIVFASDRAGGTGNRGVFSMNADGSDVTLLAEGVTNPFWSPDGGRISSWGLSGDSYDIFLMDPDGGNLVNLTDAASNDTGSSWSPDGTRIVFTSNREGDTGLYIIHVDTGAVERVNTPSPPSQPAWSP